MHFEASSLRKDYLRGQLDETSVDANPFNQFRYWLDEAIAAQLIEANAMTVATVDADGIPSARTVLLKDYNEQGFVFTTNLESDKGQQIAANRHVALLFYWPALERQVRICGVADQLSAEESTHLYNLRPVDSRISGAISPQSQVIPNRSFLEERVAAMKASLPDGEGPSRPESWGGYRVTPVSFEFWQGRQNRLHDRIRYRSDAGTWVIERLAP